VLLCAACGGLAVVLGALFAVLYFVLRSYTSSLHYFETVPSYVASVVVSFTSAHFHLTMWYQRGHLAQLERCKCQAKSIVLIPSRNSKQNGSEQQVAQMTPLHTWSLSGRVVYRPLVDDERETLFKAAIS
jgi:hypothetical protein